MDSRDDGVTVMPSIPPDDDYFKTFKGEITGDDQLDNKITIITGIMSLSIMVVIAVYAYYIQG